MSDRDLAERCANGDAAAWRALIREHDRRVLRVLWNFGGRDALDDLRQEVWARLLADDAKALRGIRAERSGALGAYIAIVAKTIATDHARRKRLETTVDESAADIADLAPNPEARLADQRGQERLRQALERVASESEHPGRDRDILRLHFEEGYTAPEIAEMGLGLAARGIEAVLRRSREKLEHLLRDDET